MPGFKYLSNSELETPEFPKQDQVLLKDDDSQLVNLFGVFCRTSQFWVRSTDWMLVHKI